MTDTLLMAAAWMHNTSVTKLGYIPLQLVTGMSCNQLGLTMENKATKSLSDMDAVLEVMERILEHRMSLEIDTSPCNYYF